jgi:hypothetical protein
MPVKKTEAILKGTLQAFVLQHYHNAHKSFLNVSDNQANFQWRLPAPYRWISLSCFMSDFSKRVIKTGQ